MIKRIEFATILLVAAFAARAEEPPKTSEAITVTATRTPSRLADTPQSVVVISRDEIATSAAATTDDLLRAVPGFTLFRRSGSRTANPTSQGVSLRGIGASGASRAVVLDDGIPLNDPFGGWVYWGRVPRAALERVEVVRGGASELYGSAAMGGVVQFVRRSSSAPALVVESTAGSQRTGTTSLFTAMRSGDWSGSVAGDLLTTRGYVLVQPSQRGAVDTRADARHTAVDATLGRAFGDEARAFLRASLYDESRNNGTPLQTNDTTINQLAGGVDRGSLSLRAWGSSQQYAQTFSAIAADRATERLTVDQHVPARGSGLSAQWSHIAGARNAIVTGVEARAVSGASNEEQFPVRGNSTFLRSFGRQRTLAAFAEDVMTATNALSITAGLRVDAWRNFDAVRNDVALADRSDTAWSPRLALLYRANDRLALTASAYRAFRAPTLNELYRGFRVGNVQTLANESLGPERLTAFEVGARSGGLRATAFWMTTDDTIANVTTSTTPALITRQRQNLGSSRSRGVEVESEWRVAHDLRLSAGWLFSDSTITSGALAGKRIPQVPRNQATLEATYAIAHLTLAAQTRWSAAQFDDDLNQLPLRSYVAADLFASTPLTSRVAVTLSIENAFDRRIETAATPVITLGQPRSIRIGLRYGR